MTPAEVNDFWFGALDAGGLPVPEVTKNWFHGGEAFDAEVRARFEGGIRAALAGRLEDWAEEPAGRLALVIVLDQLTRNAFRGGPDAFAGDARALDHARGALAAGQDRALRPIERRFLYMPFMHSEDPAMQDESVRLFRELAREVGPDPPGLIASCIDYAEGHRRVIARFGRFPARNAVLGRESTAEEAGYLAERADA